MLGPFPCPSWWGGAEPAAGAEAWGRALGGGEVQVLLHNMTDCELPTGGCRDPGGGEGFGVVRGLRFARRGRGAPPTALCYPQKGL